MTGGRTRVAWFHCFSGIAGDMALGSLLDAGADLEEVVALLRRLDVDGWALDRETVHRAGIACTRAIVEVHDDVTARSAADVIAMVRAASLPTRVEHRALAVFAALADAEGRLHGRAPSEVHLHEVGGHDAIVDVVGTAAALEVLDIDEVTASPVAFGTGTVASAHGVLPNPPPAVLRLLEGAPAYGRPVAVELTTPTGAAILHALCTTYGPMPSMTLAASGYGAGAADLDGLANCTQVVVGTAAPARVGPGQPVAVLETNLDDATGEQLADALHSLLAAGALDAWVTAAVMKKGRPGHVLHVLCDPARAETLRAVLRRTTGTFGVRETSGRRWADARRMHEVVVTGATIRMKIGPERAKPEHDDVARAAAATGLPTHEIASRAEAAWRAGQASDLADADSANADSAGADLADADSAGADSAPGGTFSPG